MLKEVNVAVVLQTRPGQDWAGLGWSRWAGGLRGVFAICHAVSCSVISEFIWINRFADATKCPCCLQPAKRCEACNVRHRHLLWQHVRWRWQRHRLRQRLEPAVAARQSQILQNIPTGGRRTDGRTDPAHLAHSVSSMRGEQELLGEHFNAMSINYVVDFQRHTHTHLYKHTTWDLLCSCFCMSHISLLIYVQYMRAGKASQRESKDMRICIYFIFFYFLEEHSFNKLQIVSEKCKQINVKKSNHIPTLKIHTAIIRAICQAVGYLSTLLGGPKGMPVPCDAGWPCLTALPSPALPCPAVLPSGSQQRKFHGKLLFCERCTKCSVLLGADRKRKRRKKREFCDSKRNYVDKWKCHNDDNLFWPLSIALSRASAAKHSSPLEFSLSSLESYM